VTDKIYDGLTIEDMIAYMQSIGLRAEPSKDTAHLILSSAGGWRFAAFLYRPNTENRYTNGQLYASHSDRTFTIGEANDWNNDRRFAKARYDRNGYPVIVYDFFINGVSEAYLREVFTMWEILMASFMDSIGKSGGKTFVSARPRSALEAQHD
jgi:hypothetical protein